MYKYLLYITLFFCIIFTNGCVTTSEFKIDDPLPRLQLQHTDSYVLDTSKLDDKFYDTVSKFQSELIYEERDGQPVVIMSQDTYSKIADIVELTNGYKDITVAQENLINVYISEINSLKSLVEIKQDQAISYQKLWIASENLYNQERKIHRRDNLINDIKFFGSNILWIVVTAL